MDGYEPGKGYKSFSSGVYFIGKFGEGKYYLVETHAPDSTTVTNSDGTTTTTSYGSNAGKVFVMTVNSSGAQAPGDAKGTINVTDESTMLLDLKTLAAAN
jgi:hypothetical protein